MRSVSSEVRISSIIFQIHVYLFKYFIICCHYVPTNSLLEHSLTYPVCEATLKLEVVRYPELAYLKAKLHLSPADVGICYFTFWFCMISILFFCCIATASCCRSAETICCLLCTSEEPCRFCTRLHATFPPSPTSLRFSEKQRTSGGHHTESSRKHKKHQISVIKFIYR